MILNEITPTINVGPGGRTSLAKVGVRPGQYVVTLEEDGSVLLQPAHVVTDAQLQLLARPDVMAIMNNAAKTPAVLGERIARPSFAE